MILEVELTEDEYFALQQLADKEKRNPGQQAAWIIFTELSIKQYLPLKFINRNNKKTEEVKS